METIVLIDGLSCYNCGKVFTLRDGKPLAKICYDNGDISVGLENSFYLECLNGCNSNPNSKNGNCPDCSNIELHNFPYDKGCYCPECGFNPDTDIVDSN